MAECTKQVRMLNQRWVGQLLSAILHFIGFAVAFFFFPLDSETLHAALKKKKTSSRVSLSLRPQGNGTKTFWVIIPFFFPSQRRKRKWQL